MAAIGINSFVGAPNYSLIPLVYLYRGSGEGGTKITMSPYPTSLEHGILFKPIVMIMDTKVNRIR